MQSGVRWPLPAPLGPSRPLSLAVGCPARLPGGTRSPSPSGGPGSPGDGEDRAEQAAEPVAVFAVRGRSGLVLGEPPPWTPCLCFPVAPVLS